MKNLLITQYTELADEMETVYSTAKICRMDNPSVCDQPLDPGKLPRILIQVNDP